MSRASLNAHYSSGMLIIRKYDRIIDISTSGMIGRLSFLSIFLKVSRRGAVCASCNNEEIDKRFTLKRSYESASSPS